MKRMPTMKNSHQWCEKLVSDFLELGDEFPAPKQVAKLLEGVK